MKISSVLRSPFSVLRSPFSVLIALYVLAAINVGSSYAQCMDGSLVRPSYFTVWVVIDQTWINKWGGNETLARQKAEQFADDAISLINSSDGSVSQFKTVFGLTVVKQFFPKAIAPAWNGEKDTWANNVANFYLGTYPCVRGVDGFLLFNDVANHGIGRVAMIKNPDPYTIAHELGHIMGLEHLTPNNNYPDCCKQTGFQTMMCTPWHGIPLLSPRNGFCYNGTQTWLTTNVFTTDFCTKTANSPTFFPSGDDFACPQPAQAPKIFISVDNDTPTAETTCGAGRDLVTITVTLVNNDSKALRYLGANIADFYSGNIEFVEDPTLDFNCIRVFPGNRTEFRVVDNVTPLCQHKIFSLDEFGTLTLRLKVRYKSGNATYPIRFYSGLDGSNPDIEKSYYVTPLHTVGPGNISGLFIPFGKPLLVKGNLVANYPTYEFSTKNLVFLPGAGLEVASGSTLKMDGVSLEGCNSMWKGITVRDGGTLETSMMTTIEDAQFAVNVQRGGNAIIRNTVFRNNNFGIRTAPEGSGAHNLVALGNRFETTGSGMKPTWGSGQQPQPGDRGFAGIYVNALSGGLNVNTDPNSGSGNFFSNLRFGVLAENTDVTVHNAIFFEMQQAARPSGYPGPTLVGRGVHVTNGHADIKGGYTGIAPDNALFSRCHTGISVQGGSIDVAGCLIGGGNNGIVAFGGNNKAYKIAWNSISASDRGISVFHQSGVLGQSYISNNEVVVDGNPNGIGIAVGGQEMFPQQEGLVSNNTVTVEGGAVGIQVGVANKLRVTQNNINLTGNSALFGIRMEGGDQNALNCNFITHTGNGNNEGIYAIHASRASVLCNTSDGPARGLRFEGMLSGKNKADVAGNTMKNNTAAGLLLGTDAVLGPQAHRGNKFEGVGAMAGAGADDHSIFTVDANENPDFLPFPVFPFGWFTDVSDPAPSYQCVPGTTCPLPAITSDYPLDIKIVKGELGGTTYQAANQWLSQRRFYERVLEEGNPYPGNPDVAAFLSQAQSNGLSNYANVQVGIRLLGGMTENSRAMAAASLLALNADLAGEAIWQSNEKTVNQIFLQTFAVGNAEFTGAQITALEGIAEGCPLSDGEAVLRARAMLEVLQNSAVFYDDVAICGVGERADNNKMIAKSALSVYPNPANDILNIEYSSAENAGIQFMIFNAQGQAVREVALRGGTGTVQVSLQGIPSGVYWYVAPGVGAGKFLIQH